MKASKSSGCTSPDLPPNAMSSLQCQQSDAAQGSYQGITIDMGPDFPTDWLHKSQVENLVILIIGSGDTPRFQSSTSLQNTATNIPTKTMNCTSLGRESLLRMSICLLRLSCACTAARPSAYTSFVSRLVLTKHKYHFIEI